MKLNLEQKRIVELEPSGHMLVKGVAGSGKTTVSVKRIPFLLSYYSSDPGDNVLLVTFNKTLLNYIKYLYKKIEEDSQMNFEFMINKNKKVSINTIDSLMYKYFLRYQKQNNVTLKIINKTKKYEFMNQAIQKLSSRYPNLKLLSIRYGAFLIDEMSWIKSCNLTELETYQNIDRIGRMNGVDGTPQKLLKNSDIREAIYELMSYFDELLFENGYVDFTKMNLIAYQQAINEPIERYKHIIVDESQDLTKVQLEFIKCIYNDKRTSSIMFVADNTQSIYSNSWLGKGRPFTTIGFDMSGKSRILTKNYRTTTEISRAAYNLIELDENIKNNIDFIKPSLIDRQGMPPIYKHFENAKKHIKFLINEIGELRNNYNYSDICIVAKENRLVESLETSLLEEKIPCELLSQKNPDFDSDKVKLVTIHSIKGLEFKVIFLIHLDEGVIPNSRIYEADDSEYLETEDRKLLYVGMTRASELLYMTSINRPSKFIKDISNSNLILKRDCSIRPYESIPITNYSFINQILDINSKEEAVRQWILRELVDVYHYPLELIKLEFPVQSFSKRGFVDICINIFINGEERPYIFVETKQYGSGIEIGFDQVISYLNSNDQVQYGVITDGLEIRIVNKKGEIMQDIPKCQPMFLPDNKEKKIYQNLKNKQKYYYSSEIDDENNIEISNFETNLIIEYIESVNVPIFGDIAAGVPKEVNNEYNEYLRIPKDWIIDVKNSFVLRVTGDSMREIGIEKGNYVIINKQNYANNGDIIVAIIGQEATLKKFMIMGDSVLLISENKDYEPIQMRKEDVIINGKVIGFFANY